MTPRASASLMRITRFQSSLRTLPGSWPAKTAIFHPSLVLRNRYVAATRSSSCPSPLRRIINPLATAKTALICLTCSSAHALRASQPPSFSRAYARLKEGGWDARSAWAELQVKQMSAVLAVASGLIIRRKGDGQELERVAATYLLRKTSDGWKIAVLAGHDPGSVLRLD